MKALVWWRESHQQSQSVLKVHYIHGKRPCLDVELTPAVCNFSLSAGVLQSKEPGVRRSPLSSSAAGAAS